MQKQAQEETPNLSIRREVLSEECRKISREAYFNSRRFPSIPVPETKEIPPIVSQILEVMNCQSLEAALTSLDELSSKQNSLTTQMKAPLEKGIISLLMKLLETQAIDSEVTKVVLRILGNVASGPQNLCKQVVEEGGIRLFLEIFNSSEQIDDKSLLETALWGLGNIAGDRKEYRVLLFEKGLFENLLLLLQKVLETTPESLGLLQHGVWLLANMCRDMPVDTDKRTYLAVEMLCKLSVRLKGDSYLLTDISWALLQLEENEDSKDNQDMLRYFLKSGCFETIDTLLNVSEMPILLPNIRLAVRISKAADKATINGCFSGDFLRTHKGLLEYKMRIVKQEFLKLLKELVKKDAGYIGVLWSLGLFAEILNLIRTGDLAVKKEAINLMKHVVLSHKEPTAYIFQDQAWNNGKGNDFQTNPYVSKGILDNEEETRVDNNTKDLIEQEERFVNATKEIIVEKEVMIPDTPPKDILEPLIRKMELTDAFVLALEETDPEMLQDCLESVYLILKENEPIVARFVVGRLEERRGVKLIENLQMHKNPGICEKAVKVLQLLLDEADNIEG